jgi:hypothetical protein
LYYKLTRLSSGRLNRRDKNPEEFARLRTKSDDRLSRGRQQLRRRRIAHHAAPTLPAIIRTMHAALIRGPQLSGFRAGAEQRCDDCAGWLRPAVADTLPALASDTAIQPAVRAQLRTRSTVRTRLIPRWPPVAADRSPRCASSRPRDRRWASATWRRHRNSRNSHRQRRRGEYREPCGEWRARGCIVH